VVTEEPFQYRKISLEGVGGELPDLPFEPQRQAIPSAQKVAKGKRTSSLPQRTLKQSMVLYGTDSILGKRQGFFSNPFLLIVEFSWEHLIG